MGCDIHVITEVKEEEVWKLNKRKIFTTYYGVPQDTSPFHWRNYAMFGFLANVRNSTIEPIQEPNGFPSDSLYLNTPLSSPIDMSYGPEEVIAYTEGESILKNINYHSHSHLYLYELLDFDYEEEYMVDIGISYRELLGTNYFESLNTLKTLGKPEDVRIIFWFDN